MWENDDPNADLDDLIFDEDSGQPTVKIPAQMQDFPLHGWGNRL